MIFSSTGFWVDSCYDDFPVQLPSDLPSLQSAVGAMEHNVGFEKIRCQCIYIKLE